MTPQRHKSRDAPTLAPVVYGSRYRSKSGREWKVISKAAVLGYVVVMPLGPDTHGGGGGVKCRRVDFMRLQREEAGWTFLEVRP